MEQCEIYTLYKINISGLASMFNLQLIKNSSYIYNVNFDHALNFPLNSLASKNFTQSCVYIDLGLLLHKMCKGECVPIREKSQ